VPEGQMRGFKDSTIQRLTPIGPSPLGEGARRADEVIQRFNPDSYRDLVSIANR